MCHRKAPDGGGKVFGESRTQGGKACTYFASHSQTSNPNPQSVFRLGAKERLRVLRAQEITVECDGVNRIGVDEENGHR
jgi:hypothetical protein